MVVDKACEDRVKAVRSEGGNLWRISTTMFGTVNSDITLEPFDKFKTDESEKAYPPIVAGQQVLNELLSIGMADDVAEH